jgi:3-hydroxy-9,10-secoandrosta-1,3,5(10)-triene-9,17-dione monooxygenase
MTARRAEVASAAGTPRIDPPELDLTPKEIIARAEALAPRLVERQAETEQLTYYPEVTHREFLEAGFYRILVPRRYGGYEFDYPTYVRVVVALARGCPSTAWCFCLAGGHALQVGSLFSEQAQAELFGTGDFRCAAVAAPAGMATRTEDGWELNSTHPYSSGAPYSTHYMGQTFTPGPAPEGPPGPILLFVAPRSQWTILDDWGDTLGLRGSGSHSVRFEGARIPAHFAIENAWMVDTDVSGGTPGLRLHGNPMYAGRTLSFFQMELASVMVGALKGAIDEYEDVLRRRKTQRPPIVFRYLDPDYQRWFGLAMGRAAAAEAMLLSCADQYMEMCHRAVETGQPFTREDDLRLNIVAREALAMSWDVMQGLVFKTAGSSLARAGQRMERIFRDMAMGWGHFGTVVGDWAGRELAREHLGLMQEGPPRPDQVHSI